jgi:phosphoribosylformylglycinamidine synthase
VVRVHGTDKALAMTTDVTPRYCYADPYEGGKQAIAEAWRNLCAVGARPLAATDCLNFGNPQRPEIMGQFVGCIEGMAAACRALDFPIVSGNVSLYNETKNEDGTSSAILPTPAIGGVGLLQDWRKSATIAFKTRGEYLWLVGADVLGGHLGQSLWLREILNRQDGPPPPVHLDAEAAAGAFVRWLIDAGHATAVHDISDGGLLVAVAEMALAGGMGAEVWPANSSDQSSEEPNALAAGLFGEGQGRYLVSLREPLHLNSMAHDAGTRAMIIGQTGFTSGLTGQEGVWVEAAYADLEAFVSLDDLRRAHEGFFPNLMGAEPAVA